MNNQTQMALEILSGYYGEPKWMTDPKQAQDSEKIIATWDSELAPYSVQQVKEACAWLTRRRKVMTFPTISILTTELVGKEPQAKEELSKGEEAMFCYNYILQHAHESIPPISKEAAQRAIWDIYGISMDGFEPDKPQEQDLSPHALQDELAKRLGYAIKTI